ncbi:MAG: DUF1512 family protein [Candidatus Aenigmarchaeota archaeon]|nr:DUF1512 family protein [Candidatus Aenigmarchaeota archaeon]
MYLAQFGSGAGQGGGDILGAIIPSAMFLLLFFYPRIAFSLQMMPALSRVADDLDALSRKGRKIVLREISAKPDRKTEESLDRFFEFFTIMPVDLDSFGIIRKIEHVIQQQKQRFDLFSSHLVPKADAEKKANITMGLAGGISLYGLSKMVRHFVEMTRKTKSFYFAMALQMQLPMIEKAAKALYRGTKALSRGWPIGDGIGPLVVARMMGNSKTKLVEEDTIMARKKLKGRNVYLIKAKGPGGRLGRPGKALESLSKKIQIDKIITVDAAGKLEGEKTGTLAEGIGVAMGGIGVEKSYIEDVAVQNRIPFDAVVVKMSHEQAISPMRKRIKDSIPKVIESIERMADETKKHDANIAIIGVGNTSGVGNSISEAEKAFKWIDTYEKRYKERMKNQKKKKRFRL